MIRSASVLPVVAVLAACASPPTLDVSLVIRNVTVVDVTDGTVRPDQVILISDNRIAGITGENLPAPAGAEVVDANGAYAIPGLWDMHAHVLYAEWPAVDGVAYPWPQYLDVLIAHGITGFRDMWGDMGVIRRLRREMTSGIRLSPRFVAPGAFLKGTEAWFAGAIVVPNPERAVFLVDSLTNSGVDFIKVFSTIEPDVFQVLMARANEIGIPVVGHVPRRMRATVASELGMRSMEHLFGVLPGCSSGRDRFFDNLGEVYSLAAIIENDPLLRVLDEGRCRELLTVLATNGTWQVPTLVNSHATTTFADTTIFNDPRLALIGPARRASWERAVSFWRSNTTTEGWQLFEDLKQRRLEIVRMMAEAGVPLLAGSDVANPFSFYGAGLHDELGLFVEAGLSPLEALQTATLNPARFLSATDSLGTLETGKLADLVLLDANPLQDIRNVRHPRAVVLNGEFLNRSFLDSLLSHVTEALSSAAR